MTYIASPYTDNSFCIMESNTGNIKSVVCIHGKVTSISNLGDGTSSIIVTNGKHVKNYIYSLRDCRCLNQITIK